jgi:hypothetical protein
MGEQAGELLRKQGFCGHLRGSRRRTNVMQRSGDDMPVLPPRSQGVVKNSLHLSRIAKPGQRLG